VSQWCSSGVMAVILAGGQGTRFWPVSRTTLPKQFLSISDDGESLIQATVRRIEPLTGSDGVSVVANDGLRHLIEQHVPHAHFISEPLAKNTAACIGLAAVYASLGSPVGDPVMIVLPADHSIRDEEALRRTLSEAVQHAQTSDVLVTIGIPPESPHTGYGYIKRGPCVAGRTHRVERFFEKPNVDRAQKYLESGEYSWNSGMFVWRASSILSAFKAHLPTMFEGLMAIKQLLQEGRDGRSQEIVNIFSSFESISIDFGVLEHARNCLVVSAEPFGWSDVGSWDQWADNFQADTNGNLIKGDAVVIDSEGCVVKSDKRLVAAVGLKDVVVIDAGDAVLVVSREHVQDVRKVVDELKRRGRTELV
jgi:mannose-1-phosphate guanylyltransferase